MLLHDDVPDYDDYIIDDRLFMDEFDERFDDYEADSCRYEDDSDWDFDFDEETFKIEEALRLRDLKRNRYERHWHNSGKGNGWKAVTKNDTQFTADRLKQQFILWSGRWWYKKERIDNLIFLNHSKGKHWYGDGIPYEYIQFENGLDRGKIYIKTYKELWQFENAAAYKTDKLHEINYTLDLILKEACVCWKLKGMTLNELMGRPKGTKTPKELQDRRDRPMLGPSPKEKHDNTDWDAILKERKPAQRWIKQAMHDLKPTNRFEFAWAIREGNARYRAWLERDVNGLAITSLFSV